MTPTTKKTAAEAGTSTTVQECSQNNSVSTLYMLKRSNGTADSFGTWSGTLLPKSDFMLMVVRFSDLQAAYKNGSAEFTVNLDCAHAHDAHIDEIRERKAAQKRRAEERDRLLQEENALIKDLTGIDLVRDDLVVFMTQARRDGEDFQPFLDALQAIDDLDLERAGLTTWDDFSGAEEGGNNED
ncbi:hypothetical protein [Corynebacterium casei]|uniref:hypothetical protein n=1 Tax=Corynebacterium casei TaxID=160386 RepID=UPI003FCF5D57